MKILLWGRQTGKTYECIKLLREHEDFCCIVWNMCAKRIYPIDVRNRVFSFRENIKGFRHCIIDEVDTIPRKKLKEIMSNLDVFFVTGTPLLDENGKSENMEWLVMKYPNDVNRKKTKLTKELKKMYGNHLGKERYLSEFECVW